MEKVYEALYDLRQEIQKDRHETNRMIQDGFHRLEDKFDDHVLHDFSELKERVSGVEKSQKIMTGTVVTLVTTFGTTIWAWLTGKI